MHRLVAVIAPTESQAEDMLEPFSEDVEVEPYVSQPRADYIKEGRSLQQWIIAHAESDTEREEARRLLALDDNGFLHWLAEDEGVELDKDGNPLSTFNPNAAWDWYERDGRWADITTPLQGVTVQDWLHPQDGTPLVPAALVVMGGWHDPQWVEPVNDMDDLKELTAGRGAERVWFYDCHQ
ncbi:hypothetical protein [Bifidobacterium felsineum]|uniref:hypothetical protein n=1 Tax=Bifidobacterium felsineum TaxID=2045440 RepID=UPI001BDC73DC|nr:hypothetical protein [Bifidobacterium felsineum]MBT1164601.1 hypothetical protein [Bifidobacterium felsineum]